jgi:hypothetical protein
MHGEPADFPACAAEFDVPAVRGEGPQQQMTAEEGRVGPQVAFVRITRGQFFKWECLDGVA